MSELDPIGAPEELPQVSILLAKARRAKGLSQEDVADELYLTSTLIRQIDEGQFERLAKPAYVRGYLRAYAKLVDLSPDDVVAAYNETQQAEVDPSEIHEVIEEPASANRFTGPVFQTALVGLGLIILVMLLVWLFADDETNRTAYRPAQIDTQDEVALTEALQPPSLVAEARTPGASETVDEQSTGGSAVQSDAQSDEAPVLSSAADQVLPASTQSAAPAKPVQSKPAQEPTAAGQSLPEKPIEALQMLDVASAKDNEGFSERVSISRSRQGDGVLITVTADGDDKLEFSFTDECWIEVADVTGNEIYGDLNRAGDTLIVFGEAPFEVLFGKAPAAQMTFNGRPIPLDRYTARDLTAKITLPQ